MAITYVGGQTNFILGSTSADATVTFSLSGGLAATPAQDDLVVVTVVASMTAGTGVTSLVTSGYTSLTQLTANDGNDVFLQTHYKFMTASPDANVVISRSGTTTNGQSYSIHVFRGVNTTTPLDVTSTSATGIDTSVPDPAAITPVTAGAWIYIGTGGAAAIGSVYTYAAFKAVLSTRCDESNSDAIVGSGYDDTWVSGSSNPAASSTGSTTITGSWAAYTLALRPSLGGGALSAVPTATLTWGSKSTATSAFTDTAAASVTWNGKSTATSNLSAIAAASVTWVGVGFILASGAFSSTAAASLTWNGKSIAASAFTDTATASLTWSGTATASSSWSAVSAASLTWNGASSAASAFTDTAAASLTWNGTGLYPAALSITAAASVTWNGAEVASATVSADWSSTAAASLTWNGASISIANLTVVAVASVTWNGTGIFPAAFDSDAAASLTWNATGLASADWSAVAAGSLTWNGAANAASDLSVTALALLTWNGISTSASAWDSDATAFLEWVGEGQGTPTTEDAIWFSTATADAQFASATIAEASFSMGAVSMIKWVSPIFHRRNVDAGGKYKDMDDDDMPFLDAVNKICIAEFFL